MKSSLLFTKTELKELNRRLDGKKQDYKIWYRVKPKLIELMEWFKLKAKIKKLLDGGKTS
jgi:hypothetical protein